MKAAQKKLDLKTTSQQMLASLAMAGQVAMMNPPPGAEAMKTPPHEEKKNKDEGERLAMDFSADEHQEVMNKILSAVNGPAGHLETESQLYLEQQLSEILGFQVMAELDGKKLNHSIGIMGSEQHLMRYPDDVLANHDAYQEAGIAPNRGAFGWFTQNGELTSEAIMREKYYFAVQLMYLPNWSQDYPELKPWYQYRKMVVVNPSEQVAVVGVIGDAGPAMWVQKQFGGSPEVIREGKIWSPNTRGKVMLLFIDDPEDKVPLGPIELDFESTLARSKGTEQLASNLLELNSN